MVRRASQQNHSQAPKPTSSAPMEEDFLKDDDDIDMATGSGSFEHLDEEAEAKASTMNEFLQLMESFQPIIPDAVTDYYLTRTGFNCSDVRIKRLLALAAQKFVADVAQDAYQYCKVRQQATAGREKRSATSKDKDKKMVLTMEDLSAALNDYGVNVKRPEYYS